MPADIFRHQIADRLIPFVERCPGTQVIMIPSVRDLISRHVAFPQSNFEKERMADLGLPKVRIDMVLEQIDRAR
jgi:DNA polymerase alpha subunit B